MEQFIIISFRGKGNADADRIFGQVALGVLQYPVYFINFIADYLGFVLLHFFHDDGKFIPPNPQHMIRLPETFF